MILFKPEHIQPILEGRKTETRRFWQDEHPRVKVGGVYQCRTRMLDKTSTFARVRILYLRWEPLGDMTEWDAKGEGYNSLAEFKVAFKRMNRMNWWPENEMVWVVGFEVVEP